MTTQVIEKLRTLVRVFRRECHRVLDSERTTIRGADAMLMALQLAIAEVNKQERGEFAVALSEVLLTWKCFLLDKLCMTHCDSPHPHNYDLIRREYDSFMKRTNTVDVIDIFMMFKQLRADSDPEEPLTATELFQFLAGNMGAPVESEPTQECPTTPSNSAKACKSKVRKIMRRLFCSYLALLVNSKDDMAVAHTLDIPSRSLGHTAFTNLKHASQGSSTSLFLTVTSFVRAIQLGGKGYAPPETDPLRKHLKGLVAYVQFTDQLDEMIGESPDPSVAGVRLVSCIRTAVLKGHSSEEQVREATEATAKELKERIAHIHNTLRSLAMSTGISPARPRAYAINHATAYGGREVVKVLLSLLDEEALAPPCRNKAELLSEDHSVLSGTDSTCLLTLYRSPEAQSGSSPEPLRRRLQSQREPSQTKVGERRVRSQFACTYQDEDLPLNRVLDFPSSSQMPTCVHPAPKRPPHPGTKAEPLETPSMLDMPAAEASAETAGPKQRGLARRNGNAHREAERAALPPTGTEGSKRKRPSREATEQAGDENQPPQKRAPPKAPGTGPAKRSSKAPGKKLIAGQGKLTSFFRL